MHWKNFLHKWQLVLATFGLCLGSFFIQRRAWVLGNNANAIGLLGCHFFRSVVLFFAWGLIFAILTNLTKSESTGAEKKLPVWGRPLMYFVIPLGCLGFYIFWPLVLVLLAMIPILGRTFYKNQLVGPITVPSLSLGVLLLTLTWYFCATTTRQAMRGLGERIQTQGDPKKLLAWAGKEIAARKNNQQEHPGIEPANIPEFIINLLGPNQGVRSATIEEGKDPAVVLRTGGSAYHFRISLFPSGFSHGPSPWWLGDDAAEVQPGILVGTEGK